MPEQQKDATESTEDVNKKELDRLVPLNDDVDGDDEIDHTGSSEDSELEENHDSDTDRPANEVLRRDISMVQLPIDSYFDRHKRTARRKRKKQPTRSILDEAATTGRPQKEEVMTQAAAIEKEFDQWHHHLTRGFNLLFYGYGSKRVMMEKFATTYCNDAPVIVVKGFLPTVTPKSILHSVSQALFNLHDGTNSGAVGVRTFRSLVEQRTFIAETLCSGGIDEVASKSFRAATSAPEPAKPRAQWAVGDVVLGQYDCNTFEATIREVHDNGDRYTVDWADGDQRNRELTRREVFSLPAGRTRARKTRKRGNAADKDWQEFTADERAAAEKIGFDEDAWQKGSETPFKKNWSDLTEDERSKLTAES